VPRLCGDACDGDVYVPAVVVCAGLVMGVTGQTWPDWFDVELMPDVRRLAEPQLTPDELLAEYWPDGDEEPDDRLDRLAHGFTRDDDWQDDSVLCRNGCGLPYSEVVAGKVRKCLGPDRDGDH